MHGLFYHFYQRKINAKTHVFQQTRHYKIIQNARFIKCHIPTLINLGMNIVKSYEIKQSGTRKVQLREERIANSADRTVEPSRSNQEADLAF